MAKATPEEKAMHALAEKDVDAALQQQLENPAPLATEKAEETVAPAPDAQPAKRGRGRPSNAEKALNDVLQKENVSGDNSGAAGATNKPGRKPGSTKSGLIDAAALGEQLVGIHALAAMFTQIPEFQLQPQEGEALAKAVVAVCQEYNLSLSGKTGAGIQLLAAAAMIYAPRILHYKGRMAAAQATEVNPNAQFTAPAAS